MDLSSLVFVAIIGVWAAYLVPHWLSRREDLSQSRTPDRFSGGLRVLQRRSRKPRPDGAVRRSGDAVLTSPRVVVDADGEYLYIPADRSLVARAERLPVETAAPATALPSATPSVRAPSVPVADAATAAPEVEPVEYPSDLELAIGGARIAARRRAVIMALLFATTVLTWSVAAMSTVSAWVAAPATGLLMLHVLASRAAGLRSRETLMLLAVQVRSAELVQARSQRQSVVGVGPAEVAATADPARTPDRVARRAAAVGAQTWDPIPVPPPTYTLKPASPRPEPAPLERPAAAEAPAAAVSRGALPRRAADVERILALESHLDELFEEPKVVNG